MGLRGTLRRLRADPVVALATLLTVALASVLLATGPIYSDAVAVGALRRSLAEAPTADTTLELTALTSVSDVENVRALGAAAIADALGRVDHELFPSILSTESFELPDQPDPERIDLATFAWLGGVETQLRVTAGTLALDTDRGGERDAVAVAVDAGAAAALGLDVGRRLRVVPRSGNAGAVVIEVVGHYEVVDPFAAFWHGRDRLVEPLAASPSFRTVTMLTSLRSMNDGVSKRPEVGLLGVPMFDQIELSDVQPLRRRLLGLEDAANAELRRGDVDEATEFEVRTSAPSVLSGRDRTLTVARSVVFAVVLQLAVLGAFALVLVAGLGVDARQAETAMLRARGASATQLVVQAAVDAVILVVPVALVAPFIATWLVGVFDDVGPLATVGLRIEPAPVPSAWFVVAMASVATVVLLTLPSWRAARRSDASARRPTRRRLTGALQRSGLDVAVLVVAALTYWQLRNLGADRAASVRGRFGVDPLLVAAPTFGLVAGAFLALRIIPASAGLAERWIRRTRSGPVALTAWQLARRPHRYSRAALLLIMAIAIGTFAVTYESTWTESQSAQAASDLGADGRLEPNRQVEGSIGALNLPALIETLPGVRAAVPVVDGTANLPVTDRPGRVVAFDAGRRDILNDGSAQRPGIGEALRSLRQLRPAIGGLELPGRPSALTLTIEAEPEPEAEQSSTVAEADDDDAVGTDDADVEVVDEQDEAPPFAASVVLVVVDGDDVVHRLDAGRLGVGRSEIKVDVTVEGPDGSPVEPRHPLSLVAIELTSAAQRARSRPIDVLLGPFDVIQSNGSRIRVPLIDSELELGTQTFGFLDERATIELGGRPPPDGVALRIATGSAFDVAPVIYTVSVRGPARPVVLPAVANASWLAASGSDVGDVVPVSLGRVEDARVEIVGSVEAVPTVDPTTTDGLLVDLPTLLWVESMPGQQVRPISTYWFAAEPGTDVDVDAFTRRPVGAVTVELLRDRERELVGNPAAVGAIGALVLGFGAAAAFAAAGFVVTVTVSARERRSEFALLRALGLGSRQHRRWMLAEQAVMVGASAGLGTLLGLALSALILPVVSLSQDGSTVFPPVSVVIPWGRIAALELIVVGGLAVGALAAAAVRGRASVGSVLRAGGEQ